jgi:PAS domain S-box-containing protein
MIFYFTIQSLLVFGLLEYSEIIVHLGYASFLSFLPLFGIVIKEFIEKNSKIIKMNNYTKNLNDVLISQSHNQLFFKGIISEGAKDLTKQVTDSINADRCSIWLYNKDKTSIICQQLYVKSEYTWYQNIKLSEKDFYPYFSALKENPIIVANDAERHPSTSCFKESYLIPLGVKSMLDVPILYKNEVIGVICIESLSKREWCESELNFAKMLSSLYSFAYSVKESNKQDERFKEMNNFIEESSLVSRADKNGKITYVNKKFEDVSGWKLSEVVGKDHYIVNSGLHPKEMWTNMYKTVIKDKKIWNSVVTNKSKKGDLYYVDTYIKAEFDSETNELMGFISIRQDVTKIVETLKEIDKKNTYLEHAAKIIRHDMHSGINTYIPRGLSSLERRISDDQVKDLKIEAPLKMIKEGLRHTQKVYKGVYEFTNLVKKDAVLNRSEFDLRSILQDYLSATAYKSQVEISDLGNFSVNEPLFCTALDNLIRNGLKYNDSNNKFVKISRFDNLLFVDDNGRGLSSEEFQSLSKPYMRKDGQKETGTGLGLNICIAILKEHGFTVDCEKRLEGGSRIKIKLY